MNIPSSIEETLHDEIFVETAFAMLKEARAQQAAQVEAMRETRTPFNMLANIARKKPESRGAIREAEERLAKTDEAIAHAEKIRVGLDAEVRRLLESHLRKEDTDYARGLDSCNHATEWLAILDRYESRLRRFLTDVAQAAKTAHSTHDRSSGRIGPAAQAVITKAVESAKALERKTSIVNRLSEEHKERVVQTPVAATELPKVPEAPYVEWAQRLASMEIGPLQEECGRIVAACESLADTGLANLRQNVNSIITYKKDLCNHYVLIKALEMRRFVRTRQIDLSNMEERIASIDNRFSGSNPSWSMGF